MADTLDVGTLSGRIELEDKFGPAVAEISNKLDMLNEKMSSSKSHAHEAAEGIIEAEVVMEAAEKALDFVKEGFVKLWEVALEGSHAADIESTFHRLTEQAGLAGDALRDNMSEALHGTITNADLMTRVNQNLAAGLKLTQEQTEVLAKGAFALAKATGEDAASALDKLSTAMVTGRTRSIALLTGKIDLSAAEEAFANKLGVTTDHLSEQGKQAAIQEVILQKVGDATARVGDQQVRLADKVQQAKVWFANLEEQVGIAINESPVLQAGLNAISDALQKTFGGDKADLVKKLVGYVEDFAIGMLSLAEAAVDAVGVIGVEWNAAIVVFESVKAGWAGIAYVAEAALLTIEKGLNAISFGALDDQVKALNNDMEGWYNTMAESEASIDKHKKAEDDWAVATGNVKDKIELVRQAMIDAKAKTDEHAESTKHVADAHTEAGAAAEKHEGAENKLGLTIGYTKEQMKNYHLALQEMAQVTGDWQKVLETVDGSVVSAVKYYLDAGVALDKLSAAYGLTETQAKAIDKEWKQDNETLKSTLKAIEDLDKAWEEYFTKQRSLTETDVKATETAALDKYNARIKALQDAGVGDKKYYDEAWDLYRKDVQLNKDALIAKDTASKAYLDQQLRNARDEYQFKLEHSDQYTREEIDNAKKRVDAIQKERDEWGKNADAIERNVDKVKLLSGEVVTLAEAQRRLDQGGSQDVTRANLSAMARFYGIPDSVATDLAKRGFSFQEIVDAYRSGNVSTWVPHGPRIPGFQEGGFADFGAGTLAMLHGPEAIVPLDKGSGLGSVTNHFYVNGTATEVARKISDEIMRRLKQQRQFGAA